METIYVTWLFIQQSFFYQFVNNFLSLLFRKINVIDMFNMVHIFQIFVVWQSTEILIGLNLWLGVYV